jgi:hypothetical protein
MASGEARAALRALAVKAAMLAGLLAAPLAIAGPPDIKAHIRQLVINRAHDGERLIDEVKLGAIEEDDDASFTFQINPNKIYWVYAACDDDCDDIDLEGSNQNGDTVDHAETSNDEPSLWIGPGQSGRKLTVKITMSRCEDDLCGFGIGLFEANK